MKDHGAFLDGKKEAAISAGSIPVEVADFYLAFFREQYAIFNSLKDFGVDFGPADTGSLPRISSDRFSFPDEARKILMESLGRLIGVIEQFNSGLTLQGFLTAAETEPLFPERLVMLLLSRDMEALGSLASEMKIAPEEMIFLTVNWVKPYFVLAGEHYGPGIDNAEWQASNCPVCGYLPDMSLIRDAEEGKRYLHCGLCEYEWRYKRIACTVCGNEDTKKLGYLTWRMIPPTGWITAILPELYQVTPGFRRTRKKMNYDLTVENILTAGLDGYLIDRGYTRP